jgi:hypothetical protein
MYEAVEIKAYVATRDVMLRNESTGTIDKCFDYTDDFKFIETGKAYDCKIELFGEAIAEKDKFSKECRVLEKDVTVGKRPMVKVAIGEDTYYLFESNAIGFLDKDRFLVSFTRKDLIQVDDIIRGDLLQLR